MRRMRIYLAGPMTGYPDFNYPAFHAAAADLRGRGFKVINPAENHGGDQSLPMIEYLRADLPQVLAVDAVALLPGWEKSTGAKIEVVVAQHAGVDVCLYQAQTITPLIPLPRGVRVILGIASIMPAMIPPGAE